MPGHVTFIHGIANQQSPDNILENWSHTLADGGDGVDLDLYGVSCSMVYWADVMYEHPSDVSQDKESVIFEGVSAAEVRPVDEGYIDAADDESEAFINALIDKYNLDADESEPVPEVHEVDASVAHKLEAVPLPWILKKPLMRIFLRDVHHYLFNSKHTPRTGETFQVQEEIRNRYVADFEAVDAHPHVVVAHSMGTVITYDVLKRLDAAKNVDALITLGSPLGLSEVQHKLKPEWSRDDGWPEKLGAWWNFADGIDPVCAADPKLASDYRRDKSEVVTDVMVKNDGAFRHPVGKYMRQPVVQDAIRTALGL